MASSLTTAMLALPNNPSGQGVVWCFPMEDATGATSTTDVSTSSHSTLTGGGSVIVHGTTLQLGPPDSSTGARSAPGGTAVVPGAAYAWTNPTSPAWSAGNGNGSILYKNITATNLDAVLGSTFSIFTVINMPAQATSRTGGLFSVGGIRVVMQGDGSRFVAYFTYTAPGASSSTTVAVNCSEPVPGGVHTLEISFDKVLFKVIVDGQIQGFALIGVNDSLQAATITSTSYPVVATTGTSSAPPLMGFSMNNFLVMNRTLDRDEHIKFARMVSAVGASKFPFKHRMKDAYVPAVQSAGLAARGCAGCGGDMAISEASISGDFGGRQFHAGCIKAYTQISPFTPNASYTALADNAARVLILAMETLSGGPLNYHDGTRWYANVDGENNPALNNTSQNAWERELLNPNAAVAELALYLEIPHNHWLWRIVRAEIERALTFQVGTPGMAPGATAAADTTASGSHGYGAIFPKIFSGSTQLSTLGTSYVTFCGGGFTQGIALMEPYIAKFEPDTWARWKTGVAALGEYIWNGYETAPPAYWLYTPNGNWALNLAYAAYGIYRVLKTPEWYARFQAILDFAVCPLSANLIPGQPTTYNPVPSSIPKNALGNYTPRGMWSAGVTYNLGDQVGIPYGGGTAVTDWAGNWVSGQSYTVGQLVKDTGFTGPSNVSVFYKCTTATAGTTRPALDTANWTANQPATWYIYLCTASSGITSSTSPLNDSTNWWLATSNASYERSGCYGIQGIAGSDAANWSDYKAWFAEWPGPGTSNGVPGSEMQSLPGYDGDYHQLDVDILGKMFAWMGGVNGCNDLTNPADWLRVKRWLNAMTNKSLLYVTVSSTVCTVDNTNGASGGYSMRHTLVDGWRNYFIYSLVATGQRNDLATNYPTVTAYNVLKVNLAGVSSLLSGYYQNSFTNMTLSTLFMTLDPTRRN